MFCSVCGTELKAGICQSCGHCISDDPLYPRAVELVLTQQQVSNALLRRALNIGRSRAEKIIQSMEQAGVISAAKIGQKRRVLLAKAVLQPVQAPVLRATDAMALHILNWVFSVFCLLSALVTLGKISSFVFLLLGLCSLPVKPVQGWFSGVLQRVRLSQLFGTARRAKLVLFAGLFLVATIFTAVQQSTTSQTGLGLAVASSSVAAIVQQANMGIARAAAPQSAAGSAVQNSPASAPQSSSAAASEAPAATVAPVATTQPTPVPQQSKPAAQQPAPAAQAPVVDEDVPPQNDSMQYIGNLNTHKFHRPSCSTLPKESNRIYFDTREEAIAAGYIPCKKCNP